MSGVFFLWAVIVSGFDTCFYRLPDVLTIPAIGVCWYWAWSTDPTWIFGGLLWAGLYLILPGFGGGDCKLAASLGTVALAHGVLGWCGAVVGASILTVIIGACAHQRVIAHGPGMLAATVFVCLW